MSINRDKSHRLDETPRHDPAPQGEAVSFQLHLAVGL